MLMAVMILVVMCLTGFVLNAQMLRYLRAQHSEVWKRLGSPTLFFNNSIQNNRAVNSFLKTRAYENLDDPTLEKRCRFLKIFNHLYLVVFALVVLLLYFTIKG